MQICLVLEYIPRWAVGNESPPPPLNDRTTELQSYSTTTAEVEEKEAVSE